MGASRPGRGEAAVRACWVAGWRWPVTWCPSPS